MKLTNDFHNTVAIVRPRADGYLNPKQVRRARKTLCGLTDCRCAKDPAGCRPAQVMPVLKGDADPAVSKGQVVEPGGGWILAWPLTNRAAKIRSKNHFAKWFLDGDLPEQIRRLEKQGVDVKAILDERLKKLGVVVDPAE